MALRVLLADESSTIKKVFQLALQDFAVEVRPVNVGVDVAPVAQSFKPDIIFADVLLQKRSGYDVAAEIKQDATLNHIPIVLMWSGFMELDEDKFQACMANAQLEKPFDVSALRKLVTDLVPRTQNQRLSQFLNFPKMPEMEMGAAPGGAPAPAPPEMSPEDLAAPEPFKQVPLAKMKGGASDKYRINLKPEEMEPSHIPVDYDMPSEKVSMDDVLKPEAVEDEPFAIKETRRTKPKGPPLNAPPIPGAKPAADEPPDLMMEEETPVRVPPSMQETKFDAKPLMPEPAAAPQMSAGQLEKIIREQSAEVIESVVWKVVPDLAAQIIERELNKLLKERESQPY